MAEEPEITNLSALPEPVTDYDGETGRTSRSARRRPVLGGTSFSNATEVDPGHLHRLDGHRRDGVLQGSAAAGAAGAGHGDHAGPEDLLALGAAELVTSRVMLYSPSRAAHQPGGQPARRWLGDGVGRVTAGQGPQPRGAAVGPSWGTPSVSTASQAGDYYVAVQVDPLQSYLTGRVMQVRVSLAVDGSADRSAGVRGGRPTPTPTPSGGRRNPSPDDRIDPLDHAADRRRYRDRPWSAAGRSGASSRSGWWPALWP